jgi:LysM repeat protein
MGSRDPSGGAASSRARGPNPAQIVAFRQRHGKVMVMNYRLPALLATVSLALVPSAAHATGTHLIVAGETLSGIAAANGLSAQALAAANGLSPSAFVVSGRTLTIPAPGATANVPAPLNGYRVRTGDTLGGIAAEHGVTLAQLAAANGLAPHGVLVVGTSLRLPSGAGAPVAAVSPGAPQTSATGLRLVNPGETLWGIALANGITPAALAAANGLSVQAHVIAGTRLKIPARGAAVAAPVTTTSPTSTAQPATQRTGAVGPAGRLTAAQIGSIAAQHGAPASLATAIAWQESGFNNAMVSPANARGIMQVMPSAWDYVQNELGAGPLDPASPTDNVRAGSLLLRQLLRETGDPATAVAAYYQGLTSVRRIGMLPETKQYVANVLSLQSRFGG